MARLDLAPSSITNIVVHAAKRISVAHKAPCVRFSWRWKPAISCRKRILSPQFEKVVAVCKWVTARHWPRPLVPAEPMIRDLASQRLGALWADYPDRATYIRGWIRSNAIDARENAAGWENPNNKLSVSLGLVFIHVVDRQVVTQIDPRPSPKGGGPPPSTWRKRVDD